MVRARKANVQPIRTPTGLPYGENAQLAAAQRTNPLPRPPVGEVKTPTIPEVTTGPGLNAGTGGGDAAKPTAAEAARNFNFQSVGLGAPSARPNEPIQHGIASGPGGGPEVLGPPSTNQSDNLHSFLAALASTPQATAEVKYLASYLAAGRR